MPDILQQTYIKVPRQKVYDLLISSEGWNAWFTDDTFLHLEADGRGEIRLSWKSSDNELPFIEDGGEILEAVDGERFVFQWSPSRMPSTVEINLADYKDGTLIMLKETGFGSTEEDISACVGCAVGWGEALTLLKVYLENGIIMKEDLIL
ncbi:SRPBCC domain-containing protein [Terribacillus sp. AE2B 122]|uniref:SRPBCC family protein n=1 Tax=Terribacillus sp. AE2B 122 TaxID=1331902 RepID=UPI001581A33D|nr:SRPBCC domain-containing protein [Terribacillus sp. AE2B 122]